MIYIKIKKMILSLIVTQNCTACKRAEYSLYRIKQQHPGIKLKVIDLNNYEGNNLSIVPALLINDELYCYGDINEEKLLTVLFSKSKIFN